MKKVLIAVIAIVVLAATPLAWLTCSQSGLVWIYQLAKSYLPGELVTTSLEGRLIGPISIETLEYSLEKASIKAQQINVDWLPIALLRATIDFHHVRIKSLDIQLPQSESRDKAMSLPDIYLPWQLALKDIVVEKLSLSLGSETYRLQRAKLNSIAFLDAVDITDFYLETEDSNLSVKGVLRPNGNYPHTLEMVWQSELPSKALIKGRGQLSGDIHNTQLNQQLTGPLDLSLKVDLYNLLKKPDWQAVVQIDKFDTRQLNADWPALTGSLKLQAVGDLDDAKLSGSINGDHPDLGAMEAQFELQRLGANTIKIDHLQIHSAQGDMHVNTYGQWQPGADKGDISLKFNWRNLHWPINQPVWFDSAQGEGSITGTVDHYKILLTSDQIWSQLPGSGWSAEIDGDLNGLRIQSLRISALNGETTAVGRLSWSPTLNWEFAINTNHLNPAGLWPQWPGRLNGTINGNGRMDNGRLVAETDIKKLDGRLRDYPVSLRSKLTWRDDGLNIAHFDLSSGNAQVNAQGRAGDISNLNWSINAQDLGALYPQASGRLQAEGTLRGPPQKPSIEAIIKGKNLVLSEYAMGAIEGKFAVDLAHWQKVDIELATQALNFKGQKLKSLNVNGNVQQLVVEAVSDDGSLQVKLAGVATNNGWRGHIAQADIESHRFADWRLTAPSHMTVEGTSLTINSLCWQDSGKASLCASLQRKDTDWHSELKISQLPLLLLSGWFPPDLRVEGKLDASAIIQFQDPKELLGQVAVALSPGSVHYPLLEGERDRWDYLGGNMDAVLDHRGLEANIGIDVNNTDNLAFSIKLPGAQILALDQQSQTLQGSARLMINNLGLVEALIPEIQGLKGEIAVNLTADGTLALPGINGNARLTKGSLRIPRLGLTIDELSLLGESTNSENIVFQLGARSGEGNLTVEGKTTLDQHMGWPTEFSITGDRLEVARIPEAQILASPDLQIKLQKRAINITGDVYIPHARLQPKDITTTARVTEDAVIVGAEQVPIEKWQVNSKVRLTFGDRVNFYGYGFEGRLGGALLLEDEPGQFSRATGEITIPEGQYRAYGQHLDVEYGRLIFSGGPADNPGLDVRAVRHVNKVTAGLKLRGTVKKPRVELFAIPAMEQTDTLAYLLLGRPLVKASTEDGDMMSQAALALGLSGGDRIVRALASRFGLDEMRVESNDDGDQTSLIMGRYLSPRLYVGYGVGLVKAINTFNLRYQLTENWQLKGESSEYPGMDILYTIDR